MGSSTTLGPRRAAAFACGDGHWKPFRNTPANGPAGGGPVRQFHILPIWRGLDKVQTEYARLSGKGRRFHQGAEYTLPGHENLQPGGQEIAQAALARTSG